MKICFVEEWLHDRVRRAAIAEEGSGRTDLCADLSHVSRADIDNFQFFKLKKMLSYAYKNSDYYRLLLDTNGISPDDIRCLDDLTKLPFTEPSALAESPYLFYCISLGDIAREYVFDSSGTTGQPKKVACTEEDIERMTEFMSVGMRTVSKSGDVVLILLPDGKPNSQADLLSKGVRKMGGIPVVGDLSAPAHEQINMIQRCRPQTIFTSTSRMHRITMECDAKSRLSGLGVKTLFLTSEYLSETLREKLQGVWDCDVHAHYGMTEMGLGVSVECHAHNGFHFNEADLLVEIVDPHTGKPMKEDEDGELVFTTLIREGTPLIRYRTHDISKIISQPCPCGAVTLRRIGNSVRKLESVVTIGNGDDIFPWYFDDVVYGIFEVMDYQLAIGKQGDQDLLEFKVEVSDQGIRSEGEIIRRLKAVPLIRKNMDLGTIAEPRVEMVNMGSLQRRTRAKKLIIDNRRILQDASSTPT